ncbi:MAG: energy transducer TonB [Acidobacteria bacterium]|nr:energy transducer TonB [Acidobacteriota bacterium]
MRFLVGALLSVVIMSATNAQTSNEFQTRGGFTIRRGPVRGVFTPEERSNYILRRAPIYPPEALAKGIQGLVKVGHEIGKDGVPQQIEVLSGPSELVNASLDAVKQWRYKPFKLNGEPVVVEMTCDINFEILPVKPVARTDNP